MRLVFMGTPDFAVPILQALTTVPQCEVVGVITRKDHPVGRGRHLESPSVKIAALKLSVPVFQPGSLKQTAAQDIVRSLQPDCIIVAAFGQILPPAIISLPGYGCLNVHASLLPRYRGASPIAAAILHGDDETGNTIMLMDAGLDTGDIIAQAAVPITQQDTTATMTDILSQHGATLLSGVLPQWLHGKLQPTPQDAHLATTTRLIQKMDGLIDWQQSALFIDRMIRAYTPWPGTASHWNDQMIKIIAAHVAQPDQFRLNADLPCGTILTEGSGAHMQVGVVCGQHTVLSLDMIQLAGKRAMPIVDAVRGRQSLIGSHFS